MKKFKEQLLKFAVFIFDILLSISISGCNIENYSARKNQKIVPQDYSDVAKNTPSGTPMVSAWKTVCAHPELGLLCGIHEVL